MLILRSMFEKETACFKKKDAPHKLLLAHFTGTLWLADKKCSQHSVTGRR